jgi:pimeloyl-ACP methyl ester carboxylesterase
VVLLLHGMNSDPGAWDDFIADTTYFPNAATVPAISNGVITKAVMNVPAAIPTAPLIYGGIVKTAQGTTPTPDKNGVLYYRVKFGAYDYNWPSGLEGVTPDNPKFTIGGAGDFTPFSGNNSLAQEVRDAVAQILIRHPNAKIFLVGHSRGGLAGRAFLQTTTYPERNAVVGLLTVGTPHQGSPLALVYNYLTTNATKAIPHTRLTDTPERANDWALVDDMADAHGFVFFQAKDHFLDVRRPTIGFLASGSPNIKQLATSVKNLPTGLQYGTLRFTNATFGILHDTASPNGAAGTLDVLRGSTGIAMYFWVPHHLSSTASNAVCMRVSAQNFLGDGIVPATSQTFTSTKPIKDFTIGAGILHADETSHMVTIRVAMMNLVGWWQ